MFDLNDGSTRVKRAESPIPSQGAIATRKPSDLDSVEAEELHGTLLGHYTRELDRQAENRRDMAVDADFYDNIQWTDEDARALRDRGQVPLVYNVISATVDWMIGTEKRGRSDYKVLPRRKEESKPAEKKSQLLKYLSDVNRTPFHKSRAFEDAVKVGIGWIEDGVSDGDGEEPLYTRYESWRNMLWDSAATELDIADGRYQFRSKWADLDIAKAMFPKRRSVIERAAEDGDRFLLYSEYGDEAMDMAEHEMADTGNPFRHPHLRQRQRVRMIEAWFRMPVVAKRFADGGFRGEIFDQWSPGHQRAVEAGARIIEKPMMRMYVAIMTIAGLLYVGESPYRHNRFPFTPVWGYRRDRDGLPYGAIRRLRDIQQDINKRASKALHILSTSKTVMDDGAVDDIDEFLDEVARPDAVIVKKTGKELRFDVDRELADAHLHLFDRAVAMIQRFSGVTEDNLGLRTNAASGIAIKRRQDQGSMSSTGFFDNLRFATQVSGEKQLANVEQFMGEEKQFRITNMRGTPDYITVNDGLPDNDIVSTKADYVISEADWRASMRQAAADELLEVLQKLPPEVALVVLDLVVENMDLPNREEIVSRIRLLTGQRDPDAEEPTPEEQAREQANQRQAAMQAALQHATLRKLVAEAVEKEMRALNAQADTASKRVGAQRSALDTAREAIMTPGAVPVADQILEESGFQSGAQPQPPVPAAPNGV